MKTTPTERGVAIIIVLMAMALLAVIALGITTLGSGNLMGAFAETESQNALLGAEGAAWVKIAQIATGDVTPIPLGATLPNGLIYGVDVVQGDGVAAAANGFVPPDGTIYVLATCRTEEGRRRQVGILGRNSDSWWDMAAFANGQITMDKDGSTRAYDSRLGAPDPNTPADPSDPNEVAMYSKASVGTNASAGAQVSLKKNKTQVGNMGVSTKAFAKVYGPPGSTAAAVITGGASVPNEYAGFETLPSVRNLPAWAELGAPAAGTTSYDDASPPPPLVEGSYGDVNLITGTNNLVLDVTGVADGTAEYRFNDVNLADSELQVTGYDPNDPVEIKVYVHQMTVTQGSVVNPTTDPGVLQFFSETTLDIEDRGTEAYFVAYALGDVIVRGKISGGYARLFGALVSNARIEVRDNAEIWYDVALLDEDTGASSFIVLSSQRY